MTRFVVVGGGAAGMSAASVANRRDSAIEAHVLEQGDHISFSACGMPYWIGGMVQGGPERLIVRTPQQARERGLQVDTGTQVVDVDPEAKTLTLETDQGQTAQGYDVLCLAPGVQAINPFRELDGVHTLRHLDDGIQLQEELNETPPEHACIIGGGFVGVEMAEAFREQGWDTTLIHSHETLLDDLVPPELGTHVNEALRTAGINLVLDDRADSLEGDTRVEGVTVGGESLPADRVILATGARPRNELAERAGCSLGPAGTIQVDRTMRTTVPDVYACGDAIGYPHKITGDRMFLPLALHANRSGRIVGENVAGGEEQFPGVLGTAVTRFETMEVASTGLTQEQATQAGFEVVSETIEASTRAGYFPGSSEARVRLTVEKQTGRLLGGQLVGGPGTGKRVDTLAAAIWMDATASQVEAMDLAYAPPVSPTWDPVAIAARIADRAAQS